MKVRKFLIALIAFFGVIGVVSTNQVDAASINSLAKKYQYSGVTYLYKMLKLEGIKYNEFPGVEYQNGKPEGIVVHETDDPGATAHDEAIYFNREWNKINAYVMLLLIASKLSKCVLLTLVLGVQGNKLITALFK